MFQSNLLSKSRASWDVATHPNLLRIVEGVVGHDCLASSFGFRNIGPGEKVQHLHTDDALYRYDVFERPFKKPLVCNSMVALQDFTAQNGATRLVPASHRWAEYPHGKSAQTDVPIHHAVMPAGSVVIWNGATWHGSGANSTEQWRDAVNMNYCRGVVRQQETRCSPPLASWSRRCRRGCRPSSATPPPAGSGTATSARRRGC